MEKPLPKAAAFRWIKKRREVEKSLVSYKAFFALQGQYIGGF
jgi:hypothetical protein